jgi:peroxin-14
MIEKHSATQSSALTDLQSELKSLKTLLLSRQNIQPPASGTSTPPSSNTTNAANALLGNGKGRSIPAWQMGPSRSETGSEAGSGVSEGEGAGDAKGKEKEVAA